MSSDGPSFSPPPPSLSFFADKVYNSTSRSRPITYLISKHFPVLSPFSFIAQRCSCFRVDNIARLHGHPTRDTIPIEGDPEHEMAESQYHEPTNRHSCCC